MRDDEWINGCRLTWYVAEPEEKENIKLGAPEPEVYARDAMRAAARRVARRVREVTAVASRPTLQRQRPFALVSPPRSSRAPVRWFASAVQPDGFARRGNGRGRGHGGDTRHAGDARSSNPHLRDVQRAIVEAPDVQTILNLCDPATVARFSSVNVATALSKMAKRAPSIAPGPSPARLAGPRLGEHPAFTALCARATHLISRNAFEHRPTCNAAHALAALQHRGHARVTAVAGAALDEPASALWRALHGAMPTMDGDAHTNTQIRREDAPPVSARQSTMFLYASALARDPPSAGVLRGIWRELRADESRVGSHHVSNLVWALGTLGLDPGPEGWGIIDRCAPAAFAAPGAFNSQNVANTWWGFAKLRRAPDARTAAALSRAAVAVADSFKPQELANAMWSSAQLAATCGVRVEPDVRRAFDAAVARTLERGATRDASGRFKSKELSQVFWHYASLNVTPRDSLWRALDAAAHAQAPFASPMDVSLTLWACATLGKAPSPRTWAAMERRTRALVSGGHVASGPGTASSGTTSSGTASSGTASPGTASSGTASSSPRPVPKGSLAERSPRGARAGHVLVEWQQVANLVWAYAKLRTMPDAATLAAIRAATTRLALEKPRDMTPQDASMLLWGNATLGTLVEPPAPATAGRATEAGIPIGIPNDVVDVDRDPSLAALFFALERHVDAFKPDELTNALWCLAVIRGVGGVGNSSGGQTFLPRRAYARMWRRLATMDARDFATEDGVLIAHHAAVTHNALLREFDDVIEMFPEGLPVMRRSLVAAAAAAWRAQNARHAREDALSSSQRRVGALLRRAKIAHESEHELAGGFGFFPASQTVDFFLPESRVVVEYDGPHHFYESAADPRRDRFFRGDAFAADETFAAHADPGVIRNVNTRLRDALLARKDVRAVVTVPWWAMRGVKHADQLEWLVRRIETAEERSVSPRPDAAARRLSLGADPEPSDTRRRELISRWLEASPASSRAKLERGFAGKGDDARWAAVVAAAREDATKVRAKLRGEIAEAAERTSRNA